MSYILGGGANVTQGLFLQAVAISSTPGIVPGLLPASLIPASTIQSLAGTNHEFTVPDGGGAGRYYIVAWCGNDVAMTLVTWSQLAQNSLSGGVPARRALIGTFSGTAGATVNITTAASQSITAIIYKIPSPYSSGATNSVVATGTSAGPDSGSAADPDSTWPDKLWLAAAAHRTATVSSAPAGYALLQGSGQQLGLAQLRNLVAPEDPGAWTFTGSASWMAMTMGVALRSYAYRPGGLLITAVSCTQSGVLTISKGPGPFTGDVTQVGQVDIPAANTRHPLSVPILIDEDLGITVSKTGTSGTLTLEMVHAEDLIAA